MDFDFNNWTTDSNLGDWTESGGSVIQLLDQLRHLPIASSSNPYMVKFISQGGSISQTMTVKGNSVYEIILMGSSSKMIPI